MEKHEDEQFEIRALDLETISSINIDDFIRDYSIDLSSAAATTTMNSTAIPSLTITNGPGGSYQGLYSPPPTAHPNNFYNVPTSGFTSINPGLHVLICRFFFTMCHSKYMLFFNCNLFFICQKHPRHHA